MNTSRYALFLVGTLLAAGVSAEETKHPASHASSGSTALHESMMPGMKAMHSMKMTGDMDRDYAAMMIAHHEQANAMNEVYLKQGTNPALKAMAEKMLAQQSKEISQLKAHK